MATLVFEPSATLKEQSPQGLAQRYLQELQSLSASMSKEFSALLLELQGLADSENPISNEFLDFLIQLKNLADRT